MAESPLEDPLLKGTPIVFLTALVTKEETKGHGAEARSRGLHLHDHEGNVIPLRIFRHERLQSFRNLFADFRRAE